MSFCARAGSFQRFGSSVIALNSSRRCPAVSQSILCLRSDSDFLIAATVFSASARMKCPLEAVRCGRYQSPGAGASSVEAARRKRPVVRLRDLDDRPVVALDRHHLVLAVTFLVPHRQGGPEREAAIVHDAEDG